MRLSAASVRSASGIKSILFTAVDAAKLIPKNANPMAKVRRPTHRNAASFRRASATAWLQ